MISPLHIVTTGARTSIGLTAGSSAAAYRAGISGMGEHPFIIDQSGDPLTVARDSRLDPELMGSNRFIALAEAALREACLPIEANRWPPGFRVPVFLGLPEYRPGFSQQDAYAVQQALTQIAGLPIQLGQVDIITQGHAAGFLALATAAEHIQRGLVEVCLVGGVDSYLHPDTIDWLDENRQLVGAVSRSGFVPGEGAGFCLLMTDRARRQLGMASLAQLAAIAIGKEDKLIKTAEVCLGAGLTSVVQKAAACLDSSQKINAVICDINGERYRGEEWGFVGLRLSTYFDDPAAYDSPADCWGDVGAASGPLFAMLACRAAARGYAIGTRTLLWASSENGVRGAALLETSDLSAGGVM